MAEMLLELGALVKQGLSSCDGCKEPSPCCVLVRHSQAAPLLCPELRWVFLGCVSLWGVLPHSPAPLLCLWLCCCWTVTISVGHFGVSPCTLRGPGGERSEDRAGQTAWSSHSTFIHLLVGTNTTSPQKSLKQNKKIFIK